MVMKTLKLLLYGCMAMTLLSVSCKDKKEEFQKTLTVGDFFEGGIIFYLG